MNKQTRYRGSLAAFGALLVALGPAPGPAQEGQAPLGVAITPAPLPPLEPFAAAPAEGAVDVVMSPSHPLFGRPLPPESPGGLRPSRNFYGMSGLIDMPTAQVQPDGELGVTIGYFGGTLRNTLSFQITPRLSGAFRYSAFFNWNSNNFDTYYDRSFDLKYQVLRERDWLPAVAVGLQDFVGTGVLAGEYVVASKTLARGLTATAGIGWGRLGSNNPLGAPFGAERPSFDVNDTGGEFSVDQWFRGDAAPFAGIEWRPNDRLGVKLEYSSDIYRDEAIERDIFERTSSWNFGVEYQYSDTTRLGLYSMYGTNIGAMVSVALNPARPPAPVQLPPPGAFPKRPSRAELPAAWNTDWTRSEPELLLLVRDNIRAAVEAEGQTVVALDLQAERLRVGVENGRYRSPALAIGRVARALATVAPLSVETFEITLVENGLALSTVTLRRTDLERLDADPQRAEQLRPLVGIAAPAPLEPETRTPGLYPRFDWSLAPYAGGSFFDPQNPVLLDLGLRARARYEISPGLIVQGAVTQVLAGNTDKQRLSNSLLPRVRTDAPLYAQETGPRLETLTLSYATALGGDVYGRASAGYFETMFGGLSTEVLWKPATSRLALGVEANYARQRAFDGGLGFRDYDVLTGHASAYYAFDNGFTGQVDMGRYLAGDWGATLTLTREFANGWRIGAFATQTDVSAEEFGEGSFDKGITLQIPLDWILLGSDTRVVGTTIRPIQRDGGARLEMDGRLYERVRAGHAARIDGEWAQVWQ